MTSSESSPSSPQANAASVDWTPQVQLISSVTKAYDAVVTTVDPHEYVTGMYVLVNVPPIYGMNINGVKSEIIVISPTEFITFINTYNGLTFSPPALAQFTPAQVSPITGLFFNSTPGSPMGNPVGGP